MGRVPTPSLPLCASEPARRCLQGIYRARQPSPGSPASVGLPAETKSRDRWAGSLRLGFDGGRRGWGIATPGGCVGGRGVLLYFHRRNSAPFFPAPAENVEKSKRRWRGTPRIDGAGERQLPAFGGSVRVSYPFAPPGRGADGGRRFGPSTPCSRPAGWAGALVQPPPRHCLRRRRRAAK